MVYNIDCNLTTRPASVFTPAAIICLPHLPILTPPPPPLRTRAVWRCSSGGPWGHAHRPPECDGRRMRRGGYASHRQQSRPNKQRGRRLRT